MSWLLRTLVAAGLAAGLSLALAGVPEAKSKDPIKVVLGSETSQHVMAQITGRALIKAGFKVEYVELAPDAVVGTLASGTVHVHPDFAVAGAETELETALTDGRVVSLGGRQTNDRDEPTQKIVWTGMKQKWPYAMKQLKRMVFPTDELARLANDADSTDRTPEQVADAWMAENRETWKSWLSASKNWMKP